VLAATATFGPSPLGVGTSEIERVDRAGAVVVGWDMAALRTYPFDPERGRLPTSLFDPRWQDLDVAARVAREVLRRQWAGEGGGPMVAEAALPKWAGPSVATARRALPVGVLVPERGGWVRGMAVNELHLRRSFGGARPAYNFHAQIVTLAFDHEGRWMVRAFLGRFGGSALDQAEVVASLRGRGFGAGAVLQANLQDQNQEVVVQGVDARLSALKELPLTLELSFGVRSTEGTAEGPERPGLEEALSLFDP
jgi:hypothetical protein